MRLFGTYVIDARSTVGTEGMLVDALGDTVSFCLVFAVEAFVACFKDGFVAITVVGSLVIGVLDAFGSVEAVVVIRACFYVIILGWLGYHGWFVLFCSVEQNVVSLLFAVDA